MSLDVGTHSENPWAPPRQGEFSFFPEKFFTTMLGSRNFEQSRISVILIKSMTQMNSIFCSVINYSPKNHLIQIQWTCSISTLARRMGLMISHNEIISYIRADQKVEVSKWLSSV